MDIVAIIPAISSESNNLPNRDILMLGNIPLIGYTIRAAKNVKKFSKIVVLTNSLEYKTIIEKYEVEVSLLEGELNCDYFSMIKGVLEKLEKAKKFFAILSPIFPFRDEIEIKKAVNLFEKKLNEFDFCISKNSKTYERVYKYDRAIFLGKRKAFLEKKYLMKSRFIFYLMDKESSIMVKDKLDFELAIAIYNKRNFGKIIEQRVKKRLEEKEKFFFQSADITLIGHSIFDNWDLTSFRGKTICNLGIGGISTEQYKKWIFDRNKIKGKSSFYFIISGTNDIINKDLSYFQISQQINSLIESIYKISPVAKVFFIETPSVAFRIDRKKEDVFSLNKVIQENLKDNCSYIPINSYLVDNFGNLKLDYTYDGVHFTEKGYEKLKEILEREIKI